MVRGSYQLSQVMTGGGQGELLGESSDGRGVVRGSYQVSQVMTGSWSGGVIR